MGSEPTRKTEIVIFFFHIPVLFLFEFPCVGSTLPIHPRLVSLFHEVRSRIAHRIYWRTEIRWVLARFCWRFFFPPDVLVAVDSQTTSRPVGWHCFPNLHAKLASLVHFTRLSMTRTANRPGKFYSLPTALHQFYGYFFFYAPRLSSNTSPLKSFTTGNHLVSQVD